MYKISLSAAFLAASILSGCAGTTGGYGPEQTWYVTPKPGSRVEVDQGLTARAGARVSIQNGQVVDAGDLFKINPYCQFRVRRSSDQMSKPLEIEPDTFTVENAYRRKDFVGLENAQYAFMTGETDFNNSPSQRTMATYLELSSPKQPEVNLLVCARWADPFDYNHVTIEEMRKILGGTARLVLAN